MGSTCENCNFSRGTQWAANLKLPTAREGVEKRQREVRNKNCNSSSLVLRRHVAAAAVGLPPFGLRLLSSCCSSQCVFIGNLGPSSKICPDNRFAIDLASFGCQVNHKSQRRKDPPTLLYCLHNSCVSLKCH